jgi:hypothetical protein
MKKKLFPNRKPLTKEEVNELRRKYQKYCKENNTDGIGEFKIKQ